MGIREIITKALGYRLSSKGGFQMYEMQMPPSWNYTSYLKAYGEIGILFSCVNVISQAVAKVPWHLYELKKDGEKEEILDHEILDLLNNPNQFQTRYQFFYLGTMYKLLVGEQFWQLNFNGKGAPAEMWQAPPACMIVVPDPQKYIAGYIFKRDDTEVKFGIEEIIHIKTPNPYNEYRGLSAAQALTVDLDSERYAAKYQQKLFFNEATPGLVVEYPAEGMPPADQRRELQEEWDRRFKGFKNRGKTAFLYGGKVNTITMSNRDMDFQKLRLYTRDMICAAYHVPPSVVGITESVNRSNAETSQYQFAQYCVHPELSEIKEALNKELVPFYGNNLYLDFENPIPEDKIASVNNAVALYKGGIITLDEARIEVDKEPLGPEMGGDDLYTEPAPQSPFGSVYDFGDNEGNTEPEEDAEDEEEKKLFKRFDTEPEQEQYWKDYVSRAESYESHAISVLKEMYLKQKVNALENLRAGKEELLDTKKARKEYINSMTPILTQVMYGAVKNGHELLEPVNPRKEVPFVLNTAAMRWLKTRIGWAADEIGEESASRLASILADGHAKGESIDQIARRIEQEFTFFSDVRSMRIARTEVMQASAQGALEGYKDMGVEKVKFYAALDERLCEDCNSLHNQIFSIKDSEGIITVHPNCRCCWLAVVE